ncbi:MAG: hypothetical protein UX49_C0008G0001, partial [Candidatus Wolfebacteria bacterium GW2011_GWC2_46_275]
PRTPILYSFHDGMDRAGFPGKVVKKGGKILSSRDLKLSKMIAYV